MQLFSNSITPKRFTVVKTLLALKMLILFEALKIIRFIEVPNSKQHPRKKVLKSKQNYDQTIMLKT